MECSFTRSHMRLRYRCCWSASALILLFASAAPAQSISGMVIDSTSQKPIANLEVNLLDQKQVAVKTLRTNKAGMFRVQMRSGNYFIGIDRIGYHAYRSKQLSVTGDSLLILRVLLRDSVAIATKDDSRRR